MTRALASAGMLAAAVLAGLGRQGLLCLVFLTAGALTGVGAARARGAVRLTWRALRFHRRVKAELDALGPTGWQLKHHVRWPEGPGEGHLALIPDGRLAFAIKDCPDAIEEFDLAQTQDFATALTQAGLPYIPVCVGTTVQIAGSANQTGALDSGAGSFTERGVLCCAPGALSSELLDAQDAFLASLADEHAHLQLLYSETEASAA